MKIALSESRRLLFALAVVLILAAGLLSLPLGTEAFTRSGHEFIYYNDAAHDTVVGVQVWCSSGAHSGWGQVTPYYTIEPSDC